MMRSGRALPSRSVVLQLLVLAEIACAVPPPVEAGVTTYTYDVHGRLKTVTIPSGADQTVTTNSYDNAGNRTSLVNLFSDITAPNTPTGLVAAAQAFDRIGLSWSTTLDIGGAPVSNYRVYRGGSNIGSPAGTSYVDQPLSANTPYTYRVSAVDASNNESMQSSPASATTPPGPDLTAPGIPSTLQGAAVSGTWINLSWGASQDNPGGSGLAGYEIFRNNGGSPIGTSSIASFADQTVTPAATFLYTVRAYDVAGNRSGMSNQIAVSTPDTIPPLAPGNPIFSAIGGSSASASWTAATDNVGVTGYRYSMNAGASWTVVGNVLATTLTGLSLGTSYTMLVQAVDVAGNWGSSASGSFATTSTATDQMTLVSGTATDSATWVQWGYLQAGMGSLTPNTTSNGKTVIRLSHYVEYFTGVSDVYFQVTGFSGNPGPAWLQSMTIGGATYTGASSLFTCSNSTTCMWYWSAAPGGINGGGTVTVIHQ
jgi:chitodextrinase